MMKKIFLFLILFSLFIVGCVEVPFGKWGMEATQPMRAS